MQRSADNKVIESSTPGLLQNFSNDDNKSKSCFCLPPCPLNQPPIKMETKKEKRSQPPSLLKDKTNSDSDEQLNVLSVQHLSVKRNSQLNSVSPTSHKVQFAALDDDDDDEEDFDETDKPAVNGLPAAVAAGNGSSSSQLNNNNNNDNSFDGDECLTRSPEKSPRHFIRDKNGKRRRTLSEASYFSAASTVSAGSAGSSSSSSSSG